jgi:hypothetical protein
MFTEKTNSHASLKEHLFTISCYMHISHLLPSESNVHLLKDKKLRLQSKNTFICHSEFLSQHRGMRNGYMRHGVSVGVSQGTTQESAHLLSKLVLALVPTTSRAISLIEYFISAMYYIL